MRERVPPSQRRRIRDDHREEENDQRMEFIHSKSNFNFVKMHLISHFRHHIYMFGNIPMYFTEYGELAHKEQIKDGWRGSNEIDAARQILSSYSRQHAIRMRILNFQCLQRAGADLTTEVVEHLEKTRPTPTPPAHRRSLKGRRDNIHDVVHFRRACDMSPQTIWRELIRYSRLSLPPERRLLENLSILRALPVELLTQLEIPVLAFQESGVYDIHRARCTGARLFCNQTSRNDCVWILASGENMYCALRGRLPARLIALFQNPVRLYAAGYCLSPRRGSIHALGRLPTTIGLRRCGNRSAQRHYPGAHNCGYWDDHRPGASDTGDRAALACQLSDRFTHV